MIAAALALLLLQPAQPAAMPAPPPAPALATSPPAAAAPAPAPAHPGTLTLVGGGRTLTLTPADLAALPRAAATMVEGGKAHTYEGVRLTPLLQRLGAPAGSALMGRRLSQVVLVSAPDGYRTLFSLAETDGSFRKEPAILADRIDGQPLSAKEGPWRVIIGGDQRPSRSARNVSRIELRTVD